MNNFKKFFDIFFTVLRVRYAIFGGKLMPIREYLSSQGFFKFDWGKITNTALKSYRY
jgi:hypothetical protein